MISSPRSRFRADLLLLLTAAIWGLAFVAQRKGMEFVGPFTFNGVRFFLGGLALLPLALRRRWSPDSLLEEGPARRKTLWGGGLLGLVLFTAASLQQAGMVYTTAGNGGFITGLYVIFVPLLALALPRHVRAGAGAWLAALLAAVGLYFLCVGDRLTINPGDGLVLASSVFWAAHILIVAWLSPLLDPLRLSIAQFFSCAILSSAAAVLFESPRTAGLISAAIPILYGGLLSIGIAYTLQVIAQQKAHPAHASIIMSLESLFAVLGGWLLLGEHLAPRGILGCALIFAGMLVSQLFPRLRKEASHSSP